MPNILVRDVDAATVDKIKSQAKRKNRSLQAEMISIIGAAAERREPISELELIRKIRNSNTKVNQTDSADLLREDRDR